MNQQDDFRNRLIASQQFTPKYREEYDRRLQSIMQGELTIGQKIILGISVIIGLLGIFVIAATFKTSNTTPQIKVAILFLGAVVLVITCFRAYILLSGRINRRTQPQIIAYIGFFGIIIFDALLLAIVSPHAGSVESIYILLVGLIPLILAVCKLISTQINQSELNIQEKLLELEMKMAETNEKLESARKEF